jgi:ATP-dependent Clp protease adapter protein ClpS
MGQEQVQKQGQSAVRPVPREPQKHEVIILNDDFTTFEFVIMVMMMLIVMPAMRMVMRTVTTEKKENT